MKRIRSLGIDNSCPRFLLAMTIVMMLLLSLTAAAQNQYYVVPSGSDSNKGTSPGAPWKTISHAIASVSLSGGATINVAAGTYTEKVSCSGYGASLCVNRSGPSTTQRLRVQCDTQWSVPSGSGCLLRNSSTDTGIGVSGSNVDVVGFDYSNANGGQGIIALCGGTTSGQCAGGNSVHLINNYMHDIGQAVNDSLGGPGCPSSGGITAGPKHGTTAYETDLQVIGNRVSNFGLFANGTWNGGKCNFAHGIYISNPNSIIENNVVIDNVVYGIVYYSYPCGGVISNNTVLRNGSSGIGVAGGDCSPSGKVTINNNISMNNKRYGIVLGTLGGTPPCDSTHRLMVSNNLMSGNSSGAVGQANSCTDVSGSVVEAPTTTFTRYSGTSNDDYHLKAGSIAISHGTTVCHDGVVLCVNALDIAGLRRPSPPSIGSYEFESSGGLPAPSGLTATVQ